MIQLNRIPPPILPLREGERRWSTQDPFVDFHFCLSDRRPCFFTFFRSFFSRIPPLPRRIRTPLRSGCWPPCPARTPPGGRRSCRLRPLPSSRPTRKGECSGNG